MVNKFTRFYPKHSLSLQPILNIHRINKYIYNGFSHKRHLTHIQ